MTLQGFYINCSLLHPSSEYQNVLQFATINPPLIDHLSFTVDIDVVTMQPVPSRDDNLWQLIWDLRQYKNDLFEACITPETRRLFQ